LFLLFSFFTVSVSVLFIVCGSGVSAAGFNLCNVSFRVYFFFEIRVLLSFFCSLFFFSAGAYRSGPRRLRTGPSASCFFSVPRSVPVSRYRRRPFLCRPSFRSPLPSVLSRPSCLCRPRSVA
jgi:hypothetical protein